MKNILAVDIGNTNITLGVFGTDGKITKKAKISTNGYSVYSRSLRELFRSSNLRPDDLDMVIISSVVPLALARFAASLGVLKISRVIKIIGRDIKAPIKNMYKNKSEVGQDRLVNAYAAKLLYGSPAVIIDFGTAITFDVLSRRGEYMGGLILPGIEMSLKSLYEKTALLPKVELREAATIIGKDTVDSIRAGILFGLGAMCDGLVKKYRNILGKNMKVIATGGNAGLIARYAKSIQIIDEDLTLRGLSAIENIENKTS